MNPENQISDTLTTGIEKKQFSAQFSADEAGAAEAFRQKAAQMGISASQLLKRCAEAFLNGEVQVTLQGDAEKVRSYYQPQVDLLTKERNELMQARYSQQQTGMAGFGGFGNVEEFVKKSLDDQRKDFQREKLEDEIKVLRKENEELESENDELDEENTALKIQNAELIKQTSVIGTVEKVAPAIGVGLGQTPLVQNFIRSLSGQMGLGSAPLDDDRTEFANELYDSAKSLDRTQLAKVLEVYSMHPQMLTETYLNFQQAFNQAPRDI